MKIRFISHQRKPVADFKIRKVGIDFIVEMQSSHGRWIKIYASSFRTDTSKFIGEILQMNGGIIAK